MDEKLLNELIPIPSLEEQRESIVEQLEAEGFTIKNFSSGSVFWTIILIFCQVRIDLLKLLRLVYKAMFVISASEKWLDVKASDYTKARKQATKAMGKLYARKNNIAYDLVIPKGYIFKSLSSLAGNEYRFVSTEKTVIPKGELIGYIPVKAEKAGSEYNVPVNSIQKSLLHIENLAEISNAEGWLTDEGADTETDEQFRQRTLNSWAELSTLPIALKYKNVAESVEGVLYVLVDDLHPRGQGTVDIIVASYAGTAGSELLAKVEAACNTIRGVYENLLVKSAETVAIDIELILYVPYSVLVDGIEDEAIEYTRDYFRLNKNRELHSLYLSELTFHIRKNMDVLKGIKVVFPSGDLLYDKFKVIILNQVNATIERV